MQLKDWLDKNDVSAPDLATRIGVTHPTIYRYLSGRVQPKRKHLTAIKEVTGGHVTANDFEELAEKNRFA